ncbi:alpha-L-iduronidase isoform X2 [Centruroides vittatus]|uniref:alpha-L-iduronidase isoform X2 n=1 Tax=Centruroides vittatus TaxID=120091 RepID=UPI0035109E8B
MWLKYLCYVIIILIKVKSYNSIKFSKLKQSNQEPLKYSINIDLSVSDGNLKHFWKNTGLCPPDPHQEAHKYLLNDQMKHNFALIGSLPHNGIEQVRIHWLLDLVKVRKTSYKHLEYSFDYLDQLIDILRSNELKLGFELMGNPSNIYNNFENNTEVYLWRDFIEILSKRYIKKYGINFVKEWNFESWNEPDHTKELEFNFTRKGFLNYYDACSEGLKLADVNLTFGGPGGSCHDPSTGQSPLCWALMEHCNNGKNFFTKKRSTRINFISIHKKGNGTSSEIIRDELETMNIIMKHYPKLKNTPLYNDESDPMVTWSKPLEWRADATYAAIAIKIIAQHLEMFYTNNTPPFNYNLLSNDNAFLSYYPHLFTQRTLFARFQMNNTKTPYTEFVKKPIYSVLGLLGLLGKKLIYVKGNWRNSKTLGAIATLNDESERFEFVLLLYNSMDTFNISSYNYLDITIHGLNITSVKDFRMVQYHINNKDTNPYFWWKKFGYPPYPSIHQFKIMRSVEDPFRLHKPKKLSYPPWKFYMKIPLPGINLLYICDKNNLPTYVKKIQILSISQQSIIITWKDPSNSFSLEMPI